MKKTENGTVVVKFSIMWFFAVIVVVGLIISFFKNYIFATNTTKEESIVAFEKNLQSVDVIQVMLTNTGSNKKLVNEQREISFTTSYEENPNLPENEEQVKQEGKAGKTQITALQEFENGIMVSEEVLSQTTVEEMIPKIIYRGTSKFLSKFKVHINDQVYLLVQDDLKETASSESNTLKTIPRYLNVTLLEAGEEWIKVSYNGQEGYLKTTNITSEAITPLIKEQNRIATLQNNLSLDMDVGKPSGLTLSDYKTIFTGNASDVNKIFENSFQTFYDVEQRYKVNGIFIASIGIHESAWGTSRIAQDKKNLFGFAAYDRDPYNSAATFDGYESSINAVAELLSKNYLNVAGTFYQME